MVMSSWHCFHQFASGTSFTADVMGLLLVVFKVILLLKFPHKQSLLRKFLKLQLKFSASLWSKFGINHILVRGSQLAQNNREIKEMYSMSCSMMSPQLMLSLKSSITESDHYSWIELFAFLGHFLTQTQTKHIFVNNFSSALNFVR
jgi:hypothetical protein